MLVVIPHAGPAGKTRLELGRSAREELSRAMLVDVLAAAVEIGTTWVVTPDPAAGAVAEEAGAAVVPDPGGGQGAAVEAALARTGAGPVLVVNSDLPSLSAADLRALAEATPASGIAVAAAEDGTTNALGLSDATVFAPLYGAGSAARFLAHAATAVSVTRPGLRDDADELADLVRLAPRSGHRTRACLAKLGLVAARA
ncbi:MAG TPA: 2-phospho-L-lactate guanylyltransferase [Gaiellaceae bacterium]|nr:2-phospho-L-lactate guanylyltransferase [Gaiellaceae bacterium]